MKNKFALLGFVSLLGLWGLYTKEIIFLPYLAFIVFFEYLFVTPDELFIANMYKAAALAFFSILTITTLSTLVFSVFNMSSNALAGGSTLGVSLGIAIFCLSTSFLEWKEKRGTRNDT